MSKPSDRKKYSKSACLLCKHLKIKCSGEPPCDNCTNRGLKCEFDKQKKRGPKPNIKTSIDNLQKEMQLVQIEKRLLQKELFQKEVLLTQVTQLAAEYWAFSLTQAMPGSVSNDFYNIFPEQQNLLEYEYSNPIDPPMLLQETSIPDSNTFQKTLFDSSAKNFDSGISYNSSQNQRFKFINITHDSFKSRNKISKRHKNFNSFNHTIDSVKDSFPIRHYTPDSLGEKYRIEHCHSNTVPNNLFEKQQINAEKYSCSTTQIPNQLINGFPIPNQPNQLIDGFPFDVSMCLDSTSFFHGTNY
ncbi:putative C6 transcription factor [Gigaspora margarita]|uniref:Putative C6 transcription factor n=1 Tax=Gigaspora margarita TaxID=4874 RepID=A0A8H4AZG2_GIGMA|nr:putative C6 transcription factor [Gigaspora margarita]